jgi:hypothetical protein
MTSAKAPKPALPRAMGANPLEGEQLLLDALYGQRAPSTKPDIIKDAPQRPKPEHYRVVSISLYVEDIERLEQMVQELKRRGHHKANKSQLIRQALAQVDLDRIIKEG